VQEAVRLKPDYALYHANLGSVLIDKGQFDPAIAECREAIRLKKDLPDAHANLGLALRSKGQLDDGIAEYREAVRLKKDLPKAHSNLGVAMAEMGQLDEAIAEFREAIRFENYHAETNKNYAATHLNLGNALRDKGRLDEAFVEYRLAIRLDKDNAYAHYGLGKHLGDKGQLDDAIGEYREAIRLNKDLAEAHCNLAQVLVLQGKFAEALPAIKRGHELGSWQPRWKYPSAEWVRLAEQLVQLDAKLAKVLSGEVEPADVQEYLMLAELCREYKKLYLAAYRLSSDALAKQPKLADDMEAGHRYSAACAAALAGCWLGKDADQTDDKERARLRRQAMTWLRAHLAAWRQILDSEPDKKRAVVHESMQYWQRDKNLACVRGPEALSKLPEDERQEWQKLWQEVEALRKSAQEPAKKAGE